MKLLKVEFENVNSLAGKWVIDLADPAFAREGLFAIVGPTGSGKTSRGSGRSRKSTFPIPTP